MFFMAFVDKKKRGAQLGLPFEKVA